MSTLFGFELMANNITINLDVMKKSPKLTMLFFHMNHCGYCERMEKKTIQNSDIQKLIKQNFTLIDLNVDEQNSVIFNNKTYTNKKFSVIQDVDFFPTVLFLDENNEIIYKAQGHRTVEKFKLILQFIQDKEFEEMSFFEYYESKTTHDKE